MAAIIQFRRDTAANWTSNNPTLAVGEIGYESDNQKYKIGDGSTAWTSLAYGGLGDISKHLIDAKGDLIVGTADNTPGILSVGSNGQMLVADSGATGGISWASQESIVNWHEAVKLATAAVISASTSTYDNGSSGVGATLTHTPASTPSGYARLQIDGTNVTTGDRVLLQDQATAAHNGIYDVTAQGVASTSAWVLTRADDFDGTPTGQIKQGDAVYALSGSSNGGQGFTVTSTSDPHTVGTHDIDFTQFTGTQAITAGTGLSITGNTINANTANAARIVVNADDIDLASTGVSAASYGSATQVPGYTVDVYGRLTAASNTTIAIPSTAVTDFTEAVQDVSGAQFATNGSHTGITATYDDGGDGAVDLALVTENVQDIVAGQLVTNGSHSGIAATYDDGGDGAIDLNVDDFTITLAGDLSGNATITNLADATLTATIVADAAVLGTDTTGNYVATIAGTANEVEVSGSGSETAAVTVGLPSDVTVTTSLTTPLVTVSGASIILEGATADDFETTLTVTDPTADRTITFPNATGTVVTTGNLSAATEHIEDTVAAQLVTNGSHSGIAATYDDGGDGAIDLNVDDFTITLAGDLGGSATITNLADATLTATIQADSVAMGTDTTGNYVATVTGTSNEVEVSGSGSETAAITVGLPSAVTVTTSLTTPLVNVSGASIVLEGATANDFETTLTVTDPTADRTITLPDVTGTVVTTGNLSATTEHIQDTVGAQLVTNGSHTHLTATYDDGGDGAVDIALNTTAVTAASYGSATAVPGYTVDAYGRLTAASNTTIAIPSTAVTDFTEAVQDVSGAQIATNGTHVGLTAAYDDAGDGAIDLTVAATLGTHTSGNYVATVAGTANEVEVSGSGSETAAVTVGLPSAVTVTTSLTTPLVNVSGASIVIEGATANDFETTLTVTDPTADRTITFGDETGTVFTTASVQALANGVTATTQSASDNSTKLATTAYVDTGLGALSSDSITDADSDTKIQVEESADEDIIRFDTAGTERMTIGATGTVTITGDLTVNGTTTEISSTTITVDDKNIEIGSVASPTDVTADGGGLTLKGATDKTWNWVNSTDAWTSSEHIDLASGKAFYIAGASVLNATTLGSAVVSSSLTSVGTIASLAATDLTVSGISTFSGTIAGASPLVFEGATADDFETTFAITDPTADRTITFQDATGTVAYLASPTFTGTPLAPTAAADTNTTQIATTAFVMTEIGDYLTTSTAASTYAPIASPTLTGTPAAPTAAADTNTTQIATTAFVMTELGDYLTTSTAASTYAPLASPTLTGVPAAPTAAADTNTTQIATTAYVQTELGALSSDSISDADSDTKIQVEESADEDIIRFDTAGTERMTIGAAGKVAIAGDLEFSDAGKIEFGTGDDLKVYANGSNSFIDHSGDGDLWIRTLGTDEDLYLNAKRALSFQTDSSTHFYINAAGNAGIGTTSPAAKLDVAGNVIYNLERETQTGTTYTFVAGDRGKYVTMNNGSAQTVTVPPNSSVAFAVGTQIQVIGLGAGEITMAAGSGVTLRYTPGLKLRAQYSSCTCIKIATDEWVLVGDLEA
jgi:hypothetical protein